MRAKIHNLLSSARGIPFVAETKIAAAVPPTHSVKKQQMIGDWGTGDHGIKPRARRYTKP